MLNFCPTCRSCSQRRIAAQSRLISNILLVCASSKIPDTCADHSSADFHDALRRGNLSFCNASRFVRATIDASIRAFANRTANIKFLLGVCIGGAIKIASKT